MGTRGDARAWMPARHIVFAQNTTISVRVRGMGISNSLYIIYKTCARVARQIWRVDLCMRENNASASA